MKILYAIQGTGNGHISRAREIVPLLQQYGELDLLVSGTEAEVSLAQPLKYKYHGISFVFGSMVGLINGPLTNSWICRKCGAICTACR